jgi:hypothetical protein
MFKRLTFVIPLLLLIVLLKPSNPAQARFNSLPDLFDLNTQGPNSSSWPVNAYATCTNLTVELWYPAEEHPIPEMPQPYDSVTWSLERVLVNGSTEIAVSETDKTVYTFPYGTPAGQKQSRTFTFATPLEAGTGLFIEVRYSVNGGELNADTGVFDIGDFDHPYWHIRAYEPLYSISTYSTYTQHFCSNNSGAPTLYVLGDVVQKEGNGGVQSYQHTLFLSKPTDKPVRVDIESRQAAGLPSYNPERPSFNGYSNRGIKFGSGVCLDSGNPGCVIPSYSTIIIPAGQTEVTLPVSRTSDTSSSFDYTREPYTFEVIRVANAKFGGKVSATLASRNDDGCYEEQAPGTCFIYVDSPYSIPPLEIDKYSFLVSNQTVNETAGSVTFDVTLTDAVDSTVTIQYETTSDGYNATAGVDYTTTTGTLTFPPNSTAPQQIVVPIINNPEAEDLEGFGLKVWNPNSVTFGLLAAAFNNVTVGTLITDYAAPPTATPTEEPTETPMSTAEATVTDEPDGTATVQPNETPTPTSTTQAVELLVNGDFEESLSSWTLKNPSRDKIKCNKDTKVFANTGECAFMLRGVAGEKTNLLQKIGLDGFAFTVNDSLILEAYVNAKGVATGKIRVSIKYTDTALTNDKISVDLRQTEQYELLTGNTTLKSGDIANIKLTISHRTQSGKVYVDTMSLKQSPVSSLMPLP